MRVIDPCNSQPQFQFAHGREEIDQFSGSFSILAAIFGRVGANQIERGYPNVTQMEVLKHFRNVAPVICMGVRDG